MKLAITTLLCLGLGGTLLGFALILLRRIMGRRIPSAFYYYAWLLVLLRFVVPLPGLVPVPTAAAAAETVTLAPETHYVRPYGAAKPAQGGGEDADAGRYVITYSEEPSAAETDAENGGAERAKSAAELLSSVWLRVKAVLTSWRFWGIVWLAGAGVTALWYILGYSRFIRAIRRTERAPTDEDLRIYFSLVSKHRPGLLRSRAVPSPMLMGLFRPVIVLPNREYEPQTLRNILAHELTHYRHGDIVFKWFAALVFSIHWINPFAALFRWEIDRACELSCDEQLLKNMSAEEKRSYGATLLELATKRRLPPRVIATSFATQKRDLKERLEQIMKYKNKGKAALAAALIAAFILAGCGAALGPSAAGADTETAASAETTPTPIPTGAASSVKEVTVSTVDELLSAIDSNTIITLSAGTYDLSTASDYGKTAQGNYEWDEVYDGYELVLTGINGLYLAADGDVTIAAIPRYADVLQFTDSSDIVLEGLTLGHTEEPGYCAGGVVYFDGVTNANLGGCKLYGCGVVGITAANSKNIYATDCDLYDCTLSAVNFLDSRDFRLMDSRVYNCSEEGYSSVFVTSMSTGFAVVNTEIRDNNGMSLISSSFSQEVYLLGCDASKGNSFTSSLFDISGGDIKLDKCALDLGSAPALYFENNDGKVVSPDGIELDGDALYSMTAEKCEYSGPNEPEKVEVDTVKFPDGTSEAHVSTVDEFLAAIAPNTTIYLDAELYDLSTASAYGGGGGDYYYWESTYDGPGLVITGVENLTLISENGTTIAAIPRYVDELTFRSCSNIALSDLTLGHTEEPGACSGGVLRLDGCTNTQIDSCHLYGCGIVGIISDDCTGLNVTDTEIYDCSTSAVQLRTTTGALFINCDIHDCSVPASYTALDGTTISYSSPLIIISESSEAEFNSCDIHDCESPVVNFSGSAVTFDGKAISNGNYKIENGGLVSYVPDAENADASSTLVSPAAA